MIEVRIYLLYIYAIIFFHSDSFTLNIRSRKYMTSLLNEKPSFQNEVYITDKLKSILEKIKSIPIIDLKYQQIMHYSNLLEEFPKKLLVKENKVLGCQSDVYVHAYINESIQDIKTVPIYFKGWSNSKLTSGLLSILIQGLSGSNAQEILNVSPNLLEYADVSQSITPSRNNGFLNMLSLIKQKASQIVSENIQNSPVKSRSKSSRKGSDRPVKLPLTARRRNSKSPSIMLIYDAIKSSIKTDAIEIIDKSEEHAKHLEMAKNEQNSITHVNVLVVSNQFSGLSELERHRLVFKILEGKGIYIGSDPTLKDSSEPVLHLHSISLRCIDLSEHRGKKSTPSLPE